jgi:hypothetical protein
MKPRVLLILTHDPRREPRALEGVRLAAGVGTWQRLDLRLYVDTPALQAFASAVEELDEGADFVRYLSVLADAQMPIHIPPDSAPGELAVPSLSLQPTSVSQLAQFAAESDYVLRF